MILWQTRKLEPTADLVHANHAEMEQRAWEAEREEFTDTLNTWTVVIFVAVAVLFVALVLHQGAVVNADAARMWGGRLP